MKKISLIAGLLLCPVYFASAQGLWLRKADFGGTARWRAVGFSIGTKGYVGTGYDGTSNKKDFWEWDQATDTWTQKADVGGTVRGSAVGFSIGTKGYIGTGTSGLSYLQDFWEWDQSSNSWTAKSNFPGIARTNAIAFSIGTKGYVGTGWNSAGRNDFYEWNQATDTWTQLSNIGTVLRDNAVGFSIGTKGYVGTGLDEVVIARKQDFWEWDQATNAWTQKASFGGSARNNAVGFSVGTAGYIGTGNQGTNTLDFWKWDQATNTWVQINSFPGAARNSAMGFSIGLYGYIGLGVSAAGTYLRDFWEINPGINPLPIELMSFEGRNEDEVNVLSWKTATETDNDYFTIEKSSDAENFEAIGIVNGAGNSTTMLEYSFTDDHPAGGVNYYRLKQTDFNGVFTCSKIIAIVNKIKMDVTIFPNPASDVLHIVSTAGKDFRLRITDAAGNTVVSRKSEGNACLQSVSGFPGGIYFVQVSDETGRHCSSVKVVIE